MTESSPDKSTLIVSPIPKLTGTLLGLAGPDRILQGNEGPIFPEFRRNPFGYDNQAADRLAKHKPDPARFPNPRQALSALPIPVQIELFNMVYNVPYIPNHSLWIAERLPLLLEYYLDRPITDREIEITQQTAICHDIAKNFETLVEVAKLSGKFTKGQRQTLHEHPKLGFYFLNQFFPKEDLRLVGVVGHHEKADGSGYPTGTSGRKIPVFAQLLAVLDKIHAMTDRNRPWNGFPYRFETARSVLEYEIRDKEIDASVVETVLAHYAEIINPRGELTLA